MPGIIPGSPSHCLRGPHRVKNMDFMAPDDAVIGARRHFSCAVGAPTAQER
ncbi:hypothetical protein NT01EI_1496 [Edwardsiella ictaluri 93-146]|uniref:Uncharacterized protein n=1 Tax=Edwardsiella ictaluri (strain 93-146) TaxID=634503 RepID=C5BFG5_EDWI9|nr:hypothetical protein NT01EI_1496 [Edwardsiella ictaluri 93-146]